MRKWYSCKVKYEKTNEKGIRKLATDVFLVDALTYTEAESRIYEVMEVDIAGEFTVTNISKTNIGDLVHFEEADYWFKCKVSYSTTNGESEKEVKINTYMLVNAEDVKEAFERVSESLNSMLVPFEIPSITKTNILEVYPYEPNDDELENIDEENPALETIDEDVM